MQYKRPIIVSLLALGILIVLSSVLFPKQLSQFASSFSTQPKSEQRSKTEEQKTGHGGYEEPLANKEQKEIDITDQGFSPKEITIKPDTVVIFHNEGKKTHSAVEDVTGTKKQFGFGTGLLKPGQELSVVEFETPGTYHYFCEIHRNEKGTIIVKE